jgi:signal transduction histidine kinase
LGCLQVYAFMHLRPAVPLHPGTEGPVRFALRFDSGGPRQPEWLSYALVAGSFLPLALRRKSPWLALALAGSSSVAYAVLPSPPAFTTLAPMLALYTLTATAKRRYAGVIAMLVTAAALSLPAIAYGNHRWVVEVGGSFALMAAAALLGDTARNRRLYVAEVEQRALDAERTREEEARRRVGEERLRIAREVHDIVAHSLSIVAVQAAAADTLVDTDPARAHESLGHIRATSKQALSELRSMLGVLRDAEAVPFEPSPDLSRLPQLIDRVRDTGLEVILDADLDAAAVPAHVSLSAFRIVQEALTNVVRHAEANRATVRLHLAGDQLMIEVLDDGIGAAARNAGRGHGIEGMAERVAVLGGTFEAHPAEKGFSVRATIPLSGEGS